MRKIINSTYITLDGAIENPHLWPSLGDAGAAESFDVQKSLLDGCDICLMGRHTYDAFAAAWPHRSGDAVADKLNAMRKVAVSTTLRDPGWNNTEVVGADVVERLRALKAENGGDIVQYGLGQVSYTLLEHGLMDEVRLWIQPLILGKDGPKTPHFLECPPSRLEFTGSRTLPNGVVIVNYACRPAA